jgi:alpha-tubulin suppressor-like RCC1 family protein
MDVWQVLQGTVQQQRAWTFGLQEPAALPAPAATEPDEAPPAGQHDLLKRSQSMQPADTAATAAGHAETASLDLQSLVEPCVSSREPRSIKDGVNFVSCSAGHQHSAAAAEGGYVFTWGSNDRGQLGCDTSANQPVAVHILTPAAQTSADKTRTCSTSGQRSNSNSTAAAGASGDGSVAASGRAMLTKLDSLKQLGSTVKLPPSLMSSLLQQRELEMAEAREQQEQQALLLQELLQHPELGQQQQLAGKPHAPEPGAAQAAAHMAVLSGIHTTPGSAHQQQRQQQDETRPQALVVYQLHLGQAVRSVACGAHHTLAALALSGLVSLQQACSLLILFDCSCSRNTKHHTCQQ